MQRPQASSGLGIGSAAIATLTISAIGQRVLNAKRLSQQDESITNLATGTVPSVMWP
jgi:hypothetical protein